APLSGAESRLCCGPRPVAPGVRAPQPGLPVGHGRGPAHGRGARYERAAPGLPPRAERPRPTAVPHLVDERDAATGVVRDDRFTSMAPRTAHRDAAHPAGRADRPPLERPQTPRAPDDPG